MRCAVVAICVALFSTSSFAESLSAIETASHIGEMATVEGVVSGVHVSAKATFINMGGAYPNNAFAGVIFSESESAFPDVQLFNGRTVQLTGTIQLYKGKPEIILRSADQLKVR